MTDPASHFDALALEYKSAARSMDDIPLVSILMPIYNAEKYLVAAVRSVWQQSHPKIEIIAVEDGSTDLSGSLIRALKDQSPVPFELIEQANSGPSAALHHALERASGAWICWLAADDLYDPEFVSTNLATATKYERSDLVLHCNAFLIEDDGTVTGTMDDISAQSPLLGCAFDQRLSGEGRMLPCTMFIRREELDRIGGFDPTMWAEDIDLFLRIGRYCWVEYITTPLFYTRYTPGSLGKKPWLFGRDILASLEKHADLLGDQLPAWRSRACENVAVACALNGAWSEAANWSTKALGQGAGSAIDALTVLRLLGRVAVVGARQTAIRAMGRDRLVRLKRKLLGQSTSTQGHRDSQRSIV